MAAAAAAGEAGSGCLSCAVCGRDLAGSARLCLDEAGTVGGLRRKANQEAGRLPCEACQNYVRVAYIDAYIDAKRKEEFQKGRLRNQLRRWPTESRHGCGPRKAASEESQRRKADMAVEDHREQGAGCGGDGWADLEPLLFDEAAAVAEHEAAAVAEHGDDGWADLEPLFLDEAAAVAEHERRMQREQAEHKQQMQMRMQREQDERKLCRARQAAMDRIREYDPKTGRTYYSRLDYIVDIATFDHDEESPLGPMRYTEALIYAHGRSQGDSANMLASDGVFFHKTANVFAIKIVSSDVGFPIDVYGTVIARDNIDLKSVYLFRRDRDHSQLILTKDESLILTGPKRGLALGSDIYFEFDLKIKCAGRQKDKQLSKGYLELNALNYRWFEEMEVESDTLDTKLSKVMITYAVVHTAVEATFAVEVLQGRFYGEITACTTGIRNSIVLHDSKMVEAITNSGKGVIQLLRNVVAVDMREKLIFTIVAWTGEGKTKSTTIRLTPGLTGGEEKEITCGSIKMCVKVTWSIISRRF